MTEFNLGNWESRSQIYLVVTVRNDPHIRVGTWVGGCLKAWCPVQLQQWHMGMLEMHILTESDLGVGPSNLPFSKPLGG